MFGFLGGTFENEFFGGEFDGIVELVEVVGGAGDFEDGDVVADGEREFSDEVVGVGGDDGGAEDMAGKVGEDFDEAVGEAIDFAGVGLGKGDERFFIFTFGADEVVFVGANGTDHRGSVSGTDETLVVRYSFDVVVEGGSKNGTLVVGEFGRGFATDTIANGEDVLGGSLEEFVDGDTGGLVFDFGVFKAKVEDGLAAGGEDDAVNAGSFVGLVVAEENAFGFGRFRLFDGGDFGVGEDGDAEVFREVISKGIASFAVFFREQMGGSFEEDDA